MEGGLRHGDDMTENDGQDRLFGPNPSGLDESPHGMMVLVIVGMIVGLLSGMFGIGGGTVIVPVLVWLGLSQRHAAATSMLAIVPTSISGVISYAHNGNVDWVAAALLSNAQSCYARAELEMTGLAGVLDDVIISSEEKIRKPARDLWQRGLARRAAAVLRHVCRRADWQLAAFAIAGTRIAMDFRSVPRVCGVQSD